MKIIKRNGAEVPYDCEKIRAAISAANDEVSEKISDTTIGFIVGKVEQRCEALARPVHVEEVQDMVIDELDKGEAYKLARHYSEYRLLHEQQRRMNTTDGKILGRHQGFWNYTIGKRKGLGIGGGTPYYVVGLNAERNEVTVGFKDESVRYDFELVDTVGEIDKSLPVKVRSAGEPRLLKDGISGIAPGQSAVFFRGDEIVGGGIIAMSK